MRGDPRPRWQGLHHLLNDAAARRRPHPLFEPRKPWEVGSRSIIGPVTLTPLKGKICSALLCHHMRSFRAVGIKSDATGGEVREFNAERRMRGSPLRHKDIKTTR